jgi:hypothetical protein
MKQIPLHAATRTLQITILRHNPRDPASTPRLQTFKVEEADAMTLFNARTRRCNSISSVAPASAAAAA